MKISIKNEDNESLYFMHTLSNVETYILIKRPNEETWYLRKILNETFTTLPLPFTVIKLDYEVIKNAEISISLIQNSVFN